MDWLSISMLHKLNTLWERGVVATACNKVGLIPPRWGGWSRIICPLTKNNKTECTFVLNIQLAKLAGNKVVATCGGESKSMFLSSLGVDRVVNYRNENIKDVSFCSSFCIYLSYSSLITFLWFLCQHKYVVFIGSLYLPGSRIISWKYVILTLEWPLTMYNAWIFSNVFELHINIYSQIHIQYI